MDTSKILEKLKTLGAIYEAHHATSFMCFRRRAEGSTEEIMVYVLDRGPQDPATRYLCEVRSESGRRIVGIPCESIEKAISMVQWDDLDREG
jgi:hypothetical protein